MACVCYLEMDTTTNTVIEEVPEPPHDYNNPALNTYELVKARFEKECFEVREPLYGYAKINQDPTDILMLSRTAMQQYYCAWSYWTTTEKGEHTERRFAPRWVKDPKRRVVDYMEIRRPKGFRRKLAPSRGWRHQE